jgi:hypothetical protein
MLQFFSANFLFPFPSLKQHRPHLAARDFSFGAEETAGSGAKADCGVLNIWWAQLIKKCNMWTPETETQHDSNFSNPMATHRMDFLLQMMRDHREPAGAQDSLKSESASDNLDIENRQETHRKSSPGLPTSRDWPFEVTTSEKHWEWIKWVATCERFDPIYLQKFSLYQPIEVWMALTPGPRTVCRNSRARPSANWGRRQLMSMLPKPGRESHPMKKSVTKLFFFLKQRYLLSGVHSWWVMILIYQNWVMIIFH